MRACNDRDMGRERPFFEHDAFQLSGDHIPKVQPDPDCAQSGSYPAAAPSIAAVPI